MNAFNKIRPKFKGTSIKCKPDLPLKPRVQQSFLLGLRWHLLQWGTVGKKEIYVDDVNMDMKVNGEKIVSSSVDDGKLIFTWHAKEWEEWTELQESAELKEFVDAAKQKLQAAAEKRSKGEGKGKKGQEGVGA